MKMQSNHYKNIMQLGLPLLLSLILTGWGIAKFLDPVLFPIQQVKIEGEIQYLAVKEVESNVLSQFQQGFFYADLLAVKHWVEDMPWVKTVSVRRVWPDVINIQVIEQQAVAMWKKTHLLNPQGVVFSPVTLPKGLPYLSGPNGSEKSVLKRYQQVSKQLQAINLNIEAIDLDERQAWHIILDNGVTLKLGREHIAQRVERIVRTFHKVLVRQNERRIKIVDLRYTNGFAIRWAQDKGTVWPRKT